MIDAQLERSDTMAAIVPDESDHMTPEYFAARFPRKPVQAGREFCRSLSSSGPILGPRSDGLVPCIEVCSEPYAYHGTTARTRN